MATPKENKAELESFLDNCTVNFYRSPDIGGYNGTALGAVSIGWGGYPSGEGAYRGWFDFKTNKQTTLAIKVQCITRFNGNVFLRAFENGRGHKILYIPDSKLPQDTGHMSHESEKKSWYDTVEPSLEVPIDDKTRDKVKEIIREVKEGEFWTIRKYATQGGQSSGSETVDDKNKFKALVEKTFSDTPCPWPVLRTRHAKYIIKQLPTDSKSLILEPTDKNDGILSVPQSHLDLNNLNKYRLEVGGDIPYVTLVATADKDASIFSNWTIANLGYNGYIYKGEKSQE